MNGTQDRRITEALEQDLEVAEHSADFFGNLRNTLQADVDSGVATTKRKNTGRFGTRNLIKYGSPAIAAGVALIVGITALQATPPVENVEPVLASQVLQQSSATFETVEGLSGNMTFTINDGAGDTVIAAVFRVSDSGSHWGRLTVKGPDIDSLTMEAALDANTRTREVVSNEGAFYQRTTGASLSEGSGVATQNPVSSLIRVMTDVREMEKVQDLELKKVTFDGRPAWEISRDQSGRLSTDAETTEQVIIDRATSFPVLVRSREASVTTEPIPGVTPPEPARYEVAITGLVVNPKFGAEDFSVPVPPGVEVSNLDDGYKVAPSGDVEWPLPGKALAPTSVPDGFTLSSVAVGKGEQDMFGDVNPSGGPAVEWAYQRGIETLTVSIWAESQGTDESFGDGFATQAITLNSGFFSGPVTFVDLGTGTSAVKGSKNGLRFEVSAPTPSRETLKMIAESIR